VTPTNTAMNNGRLNCTNQFYDVQPLLTELKDLSFEDDRVEAVKLSLRNKCLNSKDALQILDLYSFDDNKLDVAKFLSDRLFDYDNASSLSTKMTFDSNKMEYRKYIGRD
jgi:hypothetical protein